MDIINTHPLQFKSENVSDSSNSITLLFLYPRFPKDSLTFTIGGEEEETLQMSELISNINKKLNGEVKLVDCFGYQVRLDVNVGYYRNLQPLYIERIKRKRDPDEAGKFTIYVKTLTQKSIKLEVCPSFLVEDIKDLIQEKEGVPTNNQKLFFAKRQLEDEESLTDIRVQNESVLHLLLNLRGGGCGTTFVDLINDDKAQIKQWSKSAPEWRVVYGGGMCLEGICTNDACEAKGDWVIINRGSGVYDITLDKHLNQCPICKEYVEIEKVAFAKCSYRYVGTKLEKGNPPQKIVSKEIEVGDHYKLFDSEIVGSAQWASLKIVTKVIYPGTVDQASKRFKTLVSVQDLEYLCHVCSKKVDVSLTTLSCGHTYHDECYKAIQGLILNCPLCHL